MLKEKQKHELNFTQIDVSFLIFSRCRQWFMKRSTLSLCGSFLQCSLMPGSLYVPVQLLDCSLFSSKRLCLTSGGSQEYVISGVTQKLIIICLCSGKTRHCFSWYAADWDLRLFKPYSEQRQTKDAEVDGVCWRCGSYRRLCTCLSVQVSTEAEPVVQSDAQTFTIGVMPQIPGFPQLAPDCDLQITVRGKHAKRHHGGSHDMLYESLRKQWLQQQMMLLLSIIQLL